jgi:hypothetical protein
MRILDPREPLASPIAPRRDSRIYQPEGELPTYAFEPLCLLSMDVLEEALYVQALIGGEAIVLDKWIVPSPRNARL